MRRIVAWNVAILAVGSLCGPQAAPEQPAGRCDYQTCYAQWNEGELVLGNTACDARGESATDG